VFSVFSVNSAHAQQRDRVRRDCLAATDRVQSFVRFPLTLTRDGSTPSAAATRDWIAAMNGAIFGRSSRTLTSTFLHRKAGRDNVAHRVAEQLDARRVFPLRVGVGVALADVAGAGGAKDSRR
jgi:hypothetical protein